MRVLPAPGGMHPVETALRVWEADTHVKGWDQPAELATLSYGSWQGQLGLGVFPWPIDMTVGHPLIVLAGIVKAIQDDETVRRVVRGPYGGTFHGVAYMYEASCLSSDIRDSAGLARANAIADRREIHQAPDRIESRCIEAYTHDGEWHYIRTRNDAGLSEVPVSEVSAMTGTIPRLLRQILALAT